MCHHVLLLSMQTGPENQWLMEAYAKTVSSPSAAVFAQEVFERHLIPGDTDYRIFRDFGHVPGTFPFRSLASVPPILPQLQQYLTQCFF